MKSYKPERLHELASFLEELYRHVRDKKPLTELLHGEKRLLLTESANVLHDTAERIGNDDRLVDALVELLRPRLKQVIEDELPILRVRKTGDD